MACVDACEAQAIGTVERNGFYYPAIDEAKCLQCGACRRVCPALAPPPADAKSVEQADGCYAAWHTDKSVRLESSSGGVFSALAARVLEVGGVVFGAAYDSQMRLRHTAVSAAHDIDRLRRSKYVQSDARGCYRQVSELLKQGRKVLFCGTPCMTAGLRLFLGSDRTDNLLVVSLACHGVPSPVVFAHYLRRLERKYGDEVVDFNCRTKRYGWACGGFPIVTFKRVGPKTLILEDNFFLRSFIRFHHFLRPACNDCPFRCNSSGADLTLADFWGIQNYLPLKRPQDKESGFSGVLVYSGTGAAALAASAECERVPQPVQSLLRHNTGFTQKKPQRGLGAEAFLARVQADPSCSFMKVLAPISLSERMRTRERLLLQSPHSPVSSVVLGAFHVLKRMAGR
jgi:hypothetical protein